MGGVSLSRGVLGAFLPEGSRMGFLCLLKLKGGYGG